MYVYFLFYQPVTPHTNSTKIGSVAKLRSLSTSLLQLNDAQKMTYHKMKKAKQVSNQSKKRKADRRKAAKQARRYFQGRSQNAKIMTRNKWRLMKRAELSLVASLFKKGPSLKGRHSLRERIFSFQRSPL